MSATWCGWTMSRSRGEGRGRVMPKNTPQRRIDSRRQNRATTIWRDAVGASRVTDHGLLRAGRRRPQPVSAGQWHAHAGRQSGRGERHHDRRHRPVGARGGPGGAPCAGDGRQFRDFGGGQAISLAAAAAGAGLAYAAGVLSINVAGLGMSVAADAVTLSSFRRIRRRRPSWPAMRVDTSTWCGWCSPTGCARRRSTRRAGR